MGINRNELLRSIIAHRVPPADFPATFDWDLTPGQQPERLTESDVIATLHRFHRGRASAEDVANWAEFLEVRDDVEFASELVSSVVFELANPELEEPLTERHAQELMLALVDSKRLDHAGVYTIALDGGELGLISNVLIAAPDFFGAEFHALTGADPSAVWPLVDRLRQAAGLHRLPLTDD